MKKGINSLYILLAAGWLTLPGSAAQAQGGGPVTHEATESAQAVMEYWTPERMAAAIPLDVPGVVDKGLPRPAAPLPGDARPGFTLGWDPKSGLEPPDPLTRYELDDEQWASFAAHLDGQARANAPDAFGSPPAHPVDYPGYGKFARWTWYGNYLTWPTSTIGKLFFTKPGVGNFVCSATVIGRSTIAATVSPAKSVAHLPGIPTSCFALPTTRRAGPADPIPTGGAGPGLGRLPQASGLATRIPTATTPASSPTLPARCTPTRSATSPAGSGGAIIMRT